VISANNELRAWDASRPVYDGLLAPYRGQASAEFGNAFVGLAIRQSRMNLFVNLALQFCNNYGTCGRP